MLIFPLKWSPETHQYRASAVTILLDRIPEVVRAQAGRLITELDEQAVWVRQPLAYTTEQPYGFNPAVFDHLLAQDAYGPRKFLREGWLIGLVELGESYPDIPCVLWDTIAVMGLRPAPHVEEAIPNLGELLLHPWSIADAALHAAAKATAFWADICRILAERSGFYPEHGCGCDHIVRELGSGAVFPGMPDDRREQTTREWWEHFLAELALIHVLGFPFSLQSSPATVYSKTLVPA